MNEQYTADPSGKVVLITGAARRLGAATAAYLHSLGYRIIIHCHHSLDAANTLAKQLNDARADSAFVIRADLLQDDPADIISAAWQQWGQLDALINNASSFYPTRVGEFDDAAWADLIGTNLKAPAFLSQAAAPYLKERQGCIINMIDIHHERPMPGHVLYNTAKSGLAGLTRSLALELAPDIRVNGIAPGAILWPESESVDHQKNILGKIPLARSGSAQDIAKATAFLMESPYITGHVLPIDGGRNITT